MNNKITMTVVAVILIAGSFYGGMKYGETRRVSIFANRGGNFAATAGGAGEARGGFAGAGRGGGAVAGEIISQDATGITVKAQDGSSKIVLIGGSATISKQAEGSISDLAVGKTVTVVGTANSDGSITAESVQLRPAMAASTTRPQ
jgi:hypothetical protein